MCFRAQYNGPNDIRRIIEELEEEWGDGIIDFAEEIVDDQDNIYYEPEEIEIDVHDSESEEETKRADKVDVKTEDENVRFYIGKDGETLWASDSVAKNLKIKTKNIFKKFLYLWYYLTYVL